MAPLRVRPSDGPDRTMGCFLTLDLHRIVISPSSSCFFCLVPSCIRSDPFPVRVRHRSQHVYDSDYQWVIARRFKPFLYLDRQNHVVVSLLVS